MDTSVNKASWRYKMNIERPHCCDNKGVFGDGSNSFWAFNSYVSKHNKDRTKIIGRHHPLSAHTLPYWIYEARSRKL